MAVPIFVSAATIMAGLPLSVFVRYPNGDAVDCGLVSWSNLPATLTVTADPDPSTGRFVFFSSVTGTASPKATVGVATSSIFLTFDGVKFTLS